ncbi:MAG: DNA mismatch endonuclease Vsr [Terriglobales bacterium]
MTDTFSKVKRSEVMRRVHSAGTSAERKCESLLRRLKIPFQTHPAGLPGKPDFILRNCHLALFVHGCFWHSHEGCRNAELPTSNVIYWARKIEGNRRRDRRVRVDLRKAGWRTAVLWECKLRNTESVARRLLKLSKLGFRREKLR